MSILDSAKFYLSIGVVLAVITAILIPVSIFVPVYIQDQFENAILDKVLITERASQDKDNTVYQAWVDSASKGATASQLYGYIFNITNPYEVLNGEKPNVEEFGPYIYTIHKKKDQIEFDEDFFGERIVRYRETKTFIFDRKATSNKLDPDQDKFVNVNLVFQLWRALITNPTTSLIYKESEMLKRFGDSQKYDSINMDDFNRQFQIHSPNEWLFGWKDVRFDYTATTNQWFPGLMGNGTESSASFYTGESRINNAFNYLDVDGSTYVKNPFSILNPDAPLWGSFFASQFHGSDGTRFFPLSMNTSAPLVVYVSEAHRSLPLRSTHDYDLNGLKLYNYEIDPIALENSTTNPHNALWNMDTTAIFNLSGVKMMPMIVSKPHFLHCDPYLTTKVTGLKPNKKEHDTHLGVSKLTGLVMDASKSLQVSVNTIGPMKVSSVSQNWFTKMPTNTYPPVAWMNERGQIKKADAEELSATISKIDFWVSALTIGSSIICVLFLILSGVALVMAYTKKIKTVQVFNNAPAFGDYNTLN